MALSKISRDKERAAVIVKLGGCCAGCGTTEQPFHLHHIAYAPDSVRPDASGQHSVVLRVREAAAHPERFRLLCKDCHLAVETIVRMNQWDGDRRSSVMSIAESTRPFDYNA